MKTSEEIDQIAEALSLFQEKMPTVPKLHVGKVEGIARGSGKPYSYEYNYADMGDAVEAARPLLAEFGLAVVQFVGTSKGKDVLDTRVLHKSGQWIEGRARIPVQDTATVQVFGSAITYLKRYCYCAALGIIADTDDDGSLATMAYGEGSGRSRKRPPASSRSSTPGSRRIAPDPATEGVEFMSARDRNKLIAHLARELKITEPEAQTKRVNEVLGLAEGTLEWVPGLAKLTSAQGATLFAEYDLPLG